VTRDRRLQVGGWAALLVAIVTPIQLAALFFAATAGDPAASRPYVLAETLRMGALFVAVVGLDDLFRRHDPGLADRIRLLGLLGAGVSVALDAALLSGLGRTPLDLLALPASVLVGLWFIGAGLVLLGAGGAFPRIGWTALAGGVSAILAAIGVVLPLGAGGIGETGHSIRDYFVLLGVLAMVFLVRVWRYVVGGRLPGPGIL